MAEKQKAAKVLVIGSATESRGIILDAVSDSGVTVLDDPRMEYIIPRSQGLSFSIGRVTASADLALYLIGISDEYLDALDERSFTEGVIGIIILGDGVDGDAVRETRDNVTFVAANSDAPVVLVTRGLRGADQSQVNRFRSTVGLDERAGLISTESIDPNTARTALREVLKRAHAQALALRAG